MKIGKKLYLLNLLSVLILLQYCSGGSGSQNNAAESVLPAVEAVKARYGSLPLTQRFSGIVKAENQIEIYPEVTGIIVEVLAKNGDVVKKGAPLIRLREKEFRERFKQTQAGYQIAAAQLKQAEAQLNEARAELKRTQTLAEQGLASSTDLETDQTRAISAEATVELAKARLEQAKASMEERRETLSQTVIRAPVEGSVGNRNAEVGMLVNTNSRLFTLGQLDKIRIEVILTDRMLSYIDEGQRCEIFSQNLFDGSATATLSRISPFLNPVSHSTVAEIDLPNPDKKLTSGMFVIVDVHYGESETATLIPLSALFENPATGVTGIYVSKARLDREPVGQIREGEAAVLTEPIHFEFVEINVLARGRMEAGISGAEPGDWVITLGQNLLAGQPGEARVRPVKWEWVDKLQNLQREDLMEEVVKRQQAVVIDTTSSKE